MIGIGKKLKIKNEDVEKVLGTYIYRSKPPSSSSDCRGSSLPSCFKDLGENLQLYKLCYTAYDLYVPFVVEEYELLDEMLRRGLPYLKLLLIELKHDKIVFNDFMEDICEDLDVDIVLSDLEDNIKYIGNALINLIYDKIKEGEQ